jgi:DNA invertase Pin-like site-specific DNA recombinase
MQSAQTLPHVVPVSQSAAAIEKPRDMMEKPMRAALYARVSTSNHCQDVTTQTRELKEYCDRRGWEIAGEFTDHASGAKESRPALNRLMNAAVHRRFDVLLCWKLDRVGRSLRHLVNLLADLEALGISFVSLRDNLDLTTPSGRLMFHVIAAMAQFERSLIQERVKAGLRNARAKGRRLGRPPKDLDTETIATLRRQGLGWRAIAQQLGVGVGTLYRVAPGCSKTQQNVFGTR